MWRFLISALSVVVGVFAYAVPVSAYTGGDKQFISADNTFFAYVKAGDSLSASFKRVDFFEPFSTIRGDVTITIDGPGVPQQQCIAKSDVPIGQGCDFQAVKAVKSGIWRIQFSLPPEARTYHEASPVVKWGANWFSWNISIKDINGTDVPGRLWSERYSLRQPEPDRYLTDMQPYYISEDGYIYRTTVKGYNGQISSLSADAIGIRKGESCVSSYMSIDVSNTKYSPALGSCGNSYKLFFEQPSGDLPTTALQWDGKEDWVRPTISRPTIEKLSFTSDSTPDQQSGTIAYILKNFIGQYQIKIDVDNDGSFTGQSDVTLNKQMKKLSKDVQKVHFDGVDKQGQIIPTSQPVGIQVAITKVAEIHLVATDVEGRTGGLELVRLNGDNAPSTRMCWNDADLPTLASTAVMTPALDGRSCPDSTNGLHGWAYDAASWGNARYIDDWAYASAKLEGTNTIVYPDEEAVVAVAKTDNTLALVITLVCVSSIVLGIVIARIIIVKKRNSQKPPQLPPPTDFGTPTY